MHSNQKGIIIIICEFIILLIIAIFSIKTGLNRDHAIYASMYDTDKKFIKWVSFDVSSTAMEDAYSYDVKSQSKDIKINWIEILSYLGCKYGGDFSSYKKKNMDDIIGKLESGKETMKSLTEGMKFYEYYYESYDAILGGLVGPYKIEVKDENAPGGKRWENKYGLKSFLPIAKYYPYSHFDDFGVSRSYGFRRKHLGHDMMGQVGTPVIAVESGTIEALGWNQYGGWRIGIRSFDHKRYYYYAHLRKNYPYNKDLKVGSIVQAGDVIGYLGRSGYSSNENVNNITTPHLHFGLQLIFDESQKESNNEIWVDCYDLIQFLSLNRSETVKGTDTKEYHRVYQYIDPVAEHIINHRQYKYDDDEFNIKLYE